MKELRVGYQLGEDIDGIGAHIAARVMDQAGSGEVVVSRTIKDLVVGSGLRFDDRGLHALKGVPDQWQLFATVDSDTGKNRC
jgi:class 3 adenylate cyclase